MQEIERLASVFLMPITTFLFSGLVLYVAGIGLDATLMRVVWPHTDMHWRRIWSGCGMYGLVLAVGFLFDPLRHWMDVFIEQYEVIDAMGSRLSAYLFVSVVALLALSFPLTLGLIYPIGRRVEARREEENRRRDLWRETG